MSLSYYDFLIESNFSPDSSSGLSLLDVDDYIKKNNVKEVTSAKFPSSKKFDSGGLWDEEIFHRIGSKERNRQFGYIDLKTKIINPTVLPILITLSASFSEIINSKKKYTFNNGIFIEDDLNGEFGLLFFLKHFYKLNFKLIARKGKEKAAEYIEKNINLILIDKMLVLPPGGLRDLDLSKPDSIRMNAEINNIYRILLLTRKELSGVDDIDTHIVDSVQEQCNKIYTWIVNELHSKKGIMRSNMLKKSMDWSSRIVLGSRADIKIDQIGLPWHTLIVIYEPLFSHYVFHRNTSIQQLILQELKINTTTLDNNDVLKLIDNINNNHKSISIEMKTAIIKALNDFILVDAVVMVKRDPVVNRNSWFSAKPIITEGRLAYVNSTVLGTIGGDTLIYDTKINIIGDKNERRTIRMIDLLLLYDNTMLSYDENKGYTFEINDDIYIRAMNIKNYKMDWVKIKIIHLHTNTKFIKTRLKPEIIKQNLDPIFQTPEFINNFSFNFSINKACLVFDQIDQKFKKINYTELQRSLVSKKQNRYYFIIENLIPNTFEYNILKKYAIENNLHLMQVLIEKQIVSIIPANWLIYTPHTDSSIFELKIKNGNDVNECFFSSETAGIDITVDNEYGSFFTANKILNANCDGDCIAVVPIFTKQAKMQATSRLNPGVSKSKWLNIKSYGKLIYAPDHDAIAVIFNATKNK